MDCCVETYFPCYMRTQSSIFVPSNSMQQFNRYAVLHWGILWKLRTQCQVFLYLASVCRKVRDMECFTEAHSEGSVSTGFGNTASGNAPFENAHFRSGKHWLWKHKLWRFSLWKLRTHTVQRFHVHQRRCQHSRWKHPAASASSADNVALSQTSGGQKHPPFDDGEKDTNLTQHPRELTGKLKNNPWWAWLRCDRHDQVCNRLSIRWWGQWINLSVFRECKRQARHQFVVWWYKRNFCVSIYQRIRTSDEEWKQRDKTSVHCAVDLSKKLRILFPSIAKRQAIRYHSFEASWSNDIRLSEQKQETAADWRHHGHAGDYFYYENIPWS